MPPFSEDVRVSPDEFCANSPYDVGKGKAPGLFGEERVEDDQEQQVTQFILETVIISGVDRVNDFVGSSRSIPFMESKSCARSHAHPRGPRKYAVNSISLPKSFSVRSAPCRPSSTKR